MGAGLGWAVFVGECRLPPTPSPKEHPSQRRLGLKDFAQRWESPYMVHVMISRFDDNPAIPALHDLENDGTQAK